MNYKVVVFVNNKSREYIVPTIEVGVYVVCSIIEEHLRACFDDVIDFNMFSLQYLDYNDIWSDYYDEMGNEFGNVLRDGGYDPKQVVDSGRLVVPTDIKKEV